MKIEIRKGTVLQMASWLQSARDTGARDEAELRRILSLPDYQVEYARYGDPNLPTCGITPEESVDFFLHFDEKSFDNPRLEYKKASFLEFYRDLDHRLEQLSVLDAITDDDIALVQSLLKNALPNAVFDSVEQITILFTISIGNSMGWPYGNYVHFDVANLDLLGDREAFLHVLAHEIHHILFPSLLSENMTPQQYFFANFAFEGLAMHFCNNASTIGKPGKYPGSSFCVDEPSWAFFEEQHRELICRALSDGEKARDMDFDQVRQLVGEYETFTFTSLKTGETRPVQQYPTYYIGCCLWGKIDLAFGKERLFEALGSENGFEETWKKLPDAWKND